MVLKAWFRYRQAFQKLSSGRRFNNPFFSVRNLAFGGLSTVALGGLLYYHKRDSNIELSEDYFTKYQVTQNLRLDDEHTMLELKPLRPQSTNLWELMKSKKLWSVQIKQPEIMVVRNYTPLPLQKLEDGNFVALEEGDNAGGKFWLYLKKYKQGEVARWLSKLPEGHVIELRGPFIDFEFPHLPDHNTFQTPRESTQQSYTTVYDILACTAGTGIAPVMQLLLTAGDPRKVQLLHSCRSKSDLGPLYSFFNQLEHTGRLQFHLFESTAGRDIRQIQSEALKLIPMPSGNQRNIPARLEDKLHPSFALVCGPDPYITTVSGTKYDLSQGPVEGLLSQRGWSERNVYKLS
ncbi:LAQU0S04e00694g1_1 [Lachancea quebecensis]|uniref:LAQU0S04e00694g1_1 n=1 Tax=Lachancea quebecensis TaxID=1654605 RepID=A0A0P1KS85_9SACH|nr:LAQU0S04e00694g1_1 [Lachancea quebecensis]